MTESNPTDDEMRVYMRELLGKFGFTAVDTVKIITGMDSITEYSSDLGELSDDEQAQLSMLSSPMMAMLVLEVREDASDFEDTYVLLGDLFGEIIRAVYQLGKLKGHNDVTAKEA